MYLTTKVTESLKNGTTRTQVASEAKISDERLRRWLRDGSKQVLREDVLLSIEKVLKLKRTEVIEKV